LHFALFNAIEESKKQAGRTKYAEEIFHNPRAD